MPRLETDRHMALLLLLPLLHRNQLDSKKLGQASFMMSVHPYPVSRNYHYLRYPERQRLFGTPRDFVLLPNTCASDTCYDVHIGVKLTFSRVSTLYNQLQSPELKPSKFQIYHHILAILSWADGRLVVHLFLEDADPMR